MTNPNDAVGTNGAFGGRTSVNAFNDVLGTFRSRGILSGWGISASSGMTVNVGGNGTTRDVAVAEDANGNKTTINNISASPISVTLDSAPASNSRYDAIVAYVDKPPTSSATQDNPECCGIIPVTGTAASTPAYPDDGVIRSAITADGASGSTAYYVVLGYILIASGTTVITSGMITAGSLAPLASGQIDSTAIANGAVNTTNIANNAVTPSKASFTTYSTTEQAVGTWINGKTIYRKVFEATWYDANGYQVASNVEQFINQWAYVQRKDYQDVWEFVPSRGVSGGGLAVSFFANNTTTGNVQIDFGTGWSSNLNKIIIVVEYTKKS